MTIEQMIFSGAPQEDIDVAIREVAKRREEALAQKRMEEERMREEAARKEAEETRQKNALDNLFCAVIEYIRTLGVDFNDEDIKTLRPGFINMMNSLEKDPQIRIMIALAKLKGKLDKTSEPTEEKPKNCDAEDVIIRLL